MWNMDDCFTVCGGYFASRMTESAGAERLVSMDRSNEKSQAENFGADAEDTDHATGHLPEAPGHKQRV
jgi:hypothetical protein